MDRIFSIRSPTFNEPCNTVFDTYYTSTGTVRTNRANRLQQPPRPLDNIALVSQLVQQDILMLQQRWVLKQTQNLPKECYRLLIQLLGVSNIRRNNFVEGKVSSAFCKLGSVFLRSNSKLSSHGIFGFLDVGVYVVNVQAAKICGGRHGAVWSCQQCGRKE
jgi:hypothetical protein